MVALSGPGWWLLLTLCRHLIHHFKTYTSYLFPREPRASLVESKKLASLDGTFSFGLSKTTYGGIIPPVGKQITCMNVSSPIIYALDVTPAAWRPLQPSDLGGTFHIHRPCFFTSTTDFTLFDMMGIFGS